MCKHGRPLRADGRRAKDKHPPQALPRMAGLALLIALAGCAGADVSHVAAVRPAGPAPSEILVQVDASSITNPKQNAEARHIAATLQSDLVERLTRSHVTAENFMSGTDHPGAAVLHVAITRAEPGSFVERVVLGFGLGRARLEARAELVSPSRSGNVSLTAFDTTSDSGAKPGLILPGGVALATGNAIHLAIGGGIDLALNLRGGLSRPTTRTAAAIVRQVSKYYASAGWTWPNRDSA